MPAPLTSTQIIFLQALAKAPRGLTVRQLRDKTSLSPSSQSLGPLYVETAEHYPRSLIGQGLVRAEEYQEDENRFFATPSGIKAARIYTARHRLNNKSFIPPKILDPAVVKIKATKSYGLELFTDDDVAEVRALLGPKYKSVPIDDLRWRIVNRRKQGAYMKKVEIPAWYRAYRNSQHFKKIREKSLRLFGGCHLDQQHQEGLDVYHRTWIDRDGESILGRESHEDIVVLCASCYRRDRKALAEIPLEKPR